MFAADSTIYRGRFAPSPTGPLHFGSLVTAVGSYLQARSQQGNWLLRMEDLDPAREVRGAADAILRSLEAFHLYWDEAVLYQSRRLEAYDAALDQLASQQASFPCACSRKTIAEQLSGSTDADNAPGGNRVYPGTCRTGLPAGQQARAIRVRVTDSVISFVDGLQGRQQTHLSKEVGDFVVHRADGLHAYHLAVVVDDAFQGITEVVRGTDLLTATAPQLYLQSLLGLPRPHYRHLPIATNAAGQKLSKQTYAAAIDNAHPGPTLYAALAFLGHPPPVEMATATPETLLAWALENWDTGKLPACAAICIE
jgi:glutamyl-Q tRNA(Asp) synthetase